jgi:hypothetical protein
MKAALTFLIAVVLLGAAASAGAEQAQDGDVIASFDADLTPSSLPRSVPAPVAVRVAGDFRHASGDLGRLPQLRRISVGINRQGRLFDRGLPVCHFRELQPAREDRARRVCGGAIIGSGSVRLQARIPGQLPVMVDAKLLAFNGPRRGGDKLIFAQAYAVDPPGSIVLTFHVRRKPGLFGTTLTTTLPRAVSAWAYLTYFNLSLHRSYEYRGKQRGYVSAACRAPVGFETIPFPFARAVYDFDSGQRLKIAVARTCRAID